ncbi:MAG: tRNA preQ1(34) S-adenosylmethionine ribosyltransferase-isomerase QueA [Deltaproteobacteria bacterium]|nr:tRNA preQ1(34) S-adenosylmethionine ribosyltransferase-isomerase QueA [Deltaproteobacteria bacterium]
MRLKDFDYYLPEKLIAQRPCDLRDHSRMMVVRRKTEEVDCKVFHNFPDYLQKGDVLVINDSKVIPARLIGKKETGGMIEILLLSRKCEASGPLPTWEVLLRPAKRVRVGTRIVFDGDCEARVIDRVSDKKWIVTFLISVEFDLFLEKYGRAPLPPYIKRNKGSAESPEDIDRYQTIYAKRPGSVAAPTAGLHFSQNILDTLKKNGVHIVPVTLHVGYGTFLPIETDSVEKHVMEEEFFEITKEAAEVINEAKRVIAVGTTSTRVIESAADETGRIKHFSAYTGLFIYPGYRFRRVNALITNFHLPRSSLFMLVCAFAGGDLMVKAYNQAIENQFRFYSYGDCMLIV